MSEPTHKDSHIIDLAVTRQDDNIVHMTSVHSMISDHILIHIHPSDKVKFFNDKRVSCAGNQSTLFKTVDELLHRKAFQSLSAHKNIQELAGRFSK